MANEWIAAEATIGAAALGALSTIAVMSRGFQRSDRAARRRLRGVARNSLFAAYLFGEDGPQGYSRDQSGTLRSAICDLLTTSTAPEIFAALSDRAAIDISDALQTIRMQLKLLEAFESAAEAGRPLDEAIFTDFYATLSARLRGILRVLGDKTSQAEIESYRSEKRAQERANEKERWRKISEWDDLVSNVLAFERSHLGHGRPDDVDRIIFSRGIPSQSDWDRVRDWLASVVDKPRSVPLGEVQVDEVPTPKAN